MNVRSLWVALTAGLIAGLLVTVAQSISVTPLILQAEIYEASSDSGRGHDDDVGPDVWAPDDGWERTVYAGAANILAGVGFGFLIVAGFVVTGRRVGWSHGAVWGLAGFAIFAVAPGMGLPPELPGVVAAELGARQIWWLGTVAATGLGLGTVIFGTKTALKAAGVALIAVPHMIGAPQPLEMSVGVPPDLAAKFAVASLATGAFFWAVLGSTAGHFFDRWVAAPLEKPGK